jgi:hypothetical protein
MQASSAKAGEPSLVVVSRLVDVLIPHLSGPWPGAGPGLGTGAVSAISSRKEVREGAAAILFAQDFDCPGCYPQSKHGRLPSGHALMILQAEVMVIHCGEFQSIGPAPGNRAGPHMRPRASGMPAACQ